jgi:hypothetical protein
MHASRQSAARSAVGILLYARKLDGPLTATVTVRDENTKLAHTAPVGVLVPYTVERREQASRAPRV